MASNYRAACRARSKAEFLSKITIVLEEADESLYWLELVRDGELVPENQLSLLLKEADELTAIAAASINTAKRNSN